MRQRFTMPPPEAPVTLDDARAIYEHHRRNELEVGFQHADRVHEALGIALAAIDGLHDPAAEEAAPHA